MTKGIIPIQKCTSLLFALNMYIKNLLQNELVHIDKSEYLHLYMFIMRINTSTDMQIEAYCTIPAINNCHFDWLKIWLKDSEDVRIYDDGID